MGRRLKLTKGRIVAERYRAGELQRDLAREYGVSQSNISGLIKRHLTPEERESRMKRGPSRRRAPYKYVNPDPDAIASRLANGMNAADIGREFGLSRERIRQIAVEKLGMTTVRQPAVAKLANCKVCGMDYEKNHYREHCEEMGHPALTFRQTESPERVEAALRAAELYEQHPEIPLHVIAKELGFAHYEAIYRYLHRLGVPLNRKGGSYVRTPEWRRAASERMSRMRRGQR